jgi:hypothetical protein
MPNWRTKNLESGENTTSRIQVESVMCQRFQKSFTLRAANGFSKFSGTGMPMIAAAPMARSQKPEKFK